MEPTIKIKFDTDKTRESDNIIIEINTAARDLFNRVTVEGEPVDYHHCETIRKRSLVKTAIIDRYGNRYGFCFDVELLSTLKLSLEGSYNDYIRLCSLLKESTFNRFIDEINLYGQRSLTVSIAGATQ